jgi:hypothetical protein
MDNPPRRAIVRPMVHDADILIVGGGLNGPCLALALAQGGFSSIVIDALPEATRAGADFDGRSYALALASVRMLDALGLWEDLADEAQPILEIKVTDGRAGEGPSPLMLEFDHAEIEEGPMGYMIEDRFLRRALLDGLSASERVTQIRGNGRRSSGRRRLCRGPTGRRAAAAGAGDRRLRRKDEPHRRPRGHPPPGLELWADRTCLRHRARTPAQRGRPPVLHAARTARHPAVAGQPLVHRLVGIGSERRAHPGDGGRRISRGSAPALRGLPGRDRAGRQTLDLSALAVHHGALRWRPAGASGGRGPCDASHRGAGVERGAQGCGCAGRGPGRRAAPGRGHRPARGA